MRLLLAEEFHDIAPPVDYSLVPRWVILLAVVVAAVIAGLLIQAFLRARKRARPPAPPRDRAINALEQLRVHVDHLSPYEFSIRVSDVLRSYVDEQFSLPVTRQTSIEFLNSISEAQQFRAEEQSLLANFLDHCDRIKFARVAASPADSRELLDDAVQFVKGGSLVAA